MVSAKSPASPPVTLRRREAAPIAIAIAFQHNINRAKFDASDRIKLLSGHVAPAAANTFRPPHVPINIIESTATVLTSITAIERVIIQWRATGRDRIRSINPVSISDVGVVPNAMDRPTREPITAK